MIKKNEKEERPGGSDCESKTDTVRPEDGPPEDTMDLGASPSSDLQLAVTLTSARAPDVDTEDEEIDVVTEEEEGGALMRPETPPHTPAGGYCVPRHIEAYTQI